MKKGRQRRMIAVGCILVGVLVCLGVVYAPDLDLSLDGLLSSIPRNSFVSAGVLLLLYAVKSTTIFFPLLLLEVAAGYLFPIPTALGINLAGILIILTIPYWIGRRVGIGRINALADRYPKFEAVMKKQRGHSLFLCFFLRIISCLPGDLVTMYLGATHTAFRQNLFGGALGILPGMVLATIMGDGIRNPASPAFWISVTLTVALAGLSTALYYLYLRQQRGRGEGG